jgi:hypothetical protein
VITVFVDLAVMSLHKPIGDAPLLRPGGREIGAAAACVAGQRCRSRLPMLPLQYRGNVRWAWQDCGNGVAHGRLARSKLPHRAGRQGFVSLWDLAAMGTR